MNQLVPRAVAPLQRKFRVGRLIPLLILSLLFTMFVGVQKSHAMNDPEISTVRVGPIVSTTLNRRWFYLDLADKYDFQIADVQIQRGTSTRKYWVTITTAILEDYAIAKASTRATVPSGAKLRIVINGASVYSFTRA